MQTLIFVIMFGLLGGFAVGLQGPLASLMSQRLGILESIFIIHLGGAIVALSPLLLMEGGNLPHWRTVPWYALGAGALGLVVLGAVSITIPRIGAASTIILIGAILDHFGLLGIAARPIDLSRLAGMLVVFAGIWLMVR
jgi:transporter family-2 protein